MPGCRSHLERSCRWVEASELELYFKLAVDSKLANRQIAYDCATDVASYSLRSVQLAFSSLGLVLVSSLNLLVALISGLLNCPSTTKGAFSAQICCFALASIIATRAGIEVTFALASDSGSWRLDEQVGHV